MRLQTGHALVLLRESILQELKKQWMTIARWSEDGSRDGRTGMGPGCRDREADIDRAVIIVEEIMPSLLNT